MNNTILYHRIFQVLRFILVLVGLYVIYKALVFTTPLLYPFLIGFIIAYMINRPVSVLEKRFHWPRWLAISALLVVVIIIILGIATLLVTQVVIEIGKLTEMLPIYIDQLSNYAKNFFTQSIQSSLYERFVSLYSSLDVSYQQKIHETIGRTMSGLATAGTNLTKIILAGIQGILASLPNAATVMVISIMSSFFISKDYDKITDKFRSLLPDEYSLKGRRIADDLRKALFGFVKAQFTLISITAVIVIIGLLVLQVRYAVSIGLLAGLVDLMPYLGTGTVFVPWIVYSLFDHDYKLVIGLSVLYAIVIIQRQIMEPKIVATTVGLDPLLTLIALFVGLKLFGFIGLIAGPVLLVVINALQNAGVFRDTWEFIKGQPPSTPQ